MDGWTNQQHQNQDTAKPNDIGLIPFLISREMVSGYQADSMKRRSYKKILETGSCWAAAADVTTQFSLYKWWLTADADASAASTSFNRCRMCTHINSAPIDSHIMHAAASETVNYTENATYIELDLAI